MPPLIIFKGVKHQTHWYDHSNIPDDYMIEVNESAYMNDELAFESVKLFDKWSASPQIGAYRLLILDGHTTHGTREILQYCESRKILEFCMLAHTMHSC